MAVPPKVQGVHGVAWLALVGAIVTALAFPIQVSWSNPPQSDPDWPIIWDVCIAVMVLAVASCFFRKSTTNQIVATLAALMALGLSWFPLASHFGNFHTYPWHVVALLGLVGVGGGFASGMKVLPLACLAFMTLWLVPIFEPVREDFPTAKRVGPVQVTVTSLDPHFAHFQIRSLDGGNLGKTIDLQHVEIEGTVGYLIGVRGFASFNDLEEIPSKGPVQYRGMLSMPTWTRSCDLRITFQPWPAKPVAEVTIPLNALPQTPLKAAANGYSLDVSLVRRGMTESRFPAIPCLSMRVAYTGFDYSGNRGSEFRVIDDLGNPVVSLCGSAGVWQDLEMPWLDPKAKSLRVQLFRQQDLDKARTTVVFERVGLLQAESPGS